MKAILGVVGIAIAVVLVAEGLGRREEIYGGACGGAVLGLIGLAFAWKIRRQHLADAAPKTDKADAPSKGKYDVMGLWGAGMLCRLAVLGGLALLYGRWFEDLKFALLTTGAVYLILMFWEAAWLMQAFTKRAHTRPNEAENG